ncbi:MAG TPA: Pr6Pr family membrane protein, partial [Ktedonobacterales bacterium]|nr:Pr6Pr family membrane protein [Ktedonobacterales bacterium]
MPTPTDDLIRGASVVAMAAGGIVFSVLLQDTDLGTLLPWFNVVLHYVMPIAVVADWLYQPPKSTITPRQIGYWLIYPLLYVI